MGSENCMNSSCGAAITHEWKKGWPLRSGGFAHLCYPCGSAYEDGIFCNTFHLGESGWRECRLCGNYLHCGCIASKYLLDFLDYGGVACISCAKSSQLHSVKRIQTHGDGISEGFGEVPMNNARSNATEGKAVNDRVDETTLAQLCKPMEANECNLLPQSQRGDANASFGQHRGEEVICPIEKLGCSNAMQPNVQPANFAKIDNARPTLDIRDIHDLLPQPYLSMSLGGTSGNPNILLPFCGGLPDGKEPSKTRSTFQEAQQSRRILPKPSKNGPTANSELNKGMVPHAHITRPPVEGRGKNHLLPRYWPRITDQELQKLSGDLKSTIVPLFEKVLSASDAGRIGRLVLPKACAEAYFPPISQSEGLPLRIQDVNGKEWTFQFRFWPNNNSRMYVLEGVTPCIQSMELRAGDTVIFSRIDPGGKLVMGFRKAKDSDTQTPKGGKDLHVNALSKHLGLPNENVSQGRDENHGNGANGNLVQQLTLNGEKKRTRNIGFKSKRLLMHSVDALELRLTWEEAQDLLRPPPSVRPSIVTIEDHEFEEYDEPPVFGKMTIFGARPSGGQEQWAQCDDCSKWRRLPIDVLLPPKWKCSDNVWDLSSNVFLGVHVLHQRRLAQRNWRIFSKWVQVGHCPRRDLKKAKVVESPKLAPKPEPSGLDALASAAVLGDKMGNVGESSVAATTKHPRHRPGCTCIVCIQPPSGKGKHKSTCTCNVCLTVKRRFKTLMLRKKKHQSEREAEISQKDNKKQMDETEVKDTRNDHSENEASQSRIEVEKHIKQNGIASLNSEQHQEGSLGSHLQSKANRENERPLSDEEFLASVGWQREGHEEPTTERNCLQ
ncbi:hypothetical protein V6N11_028953 [Hibiscus sabdariffa]|uniref:B3 domain-containing transcription repressor VAL1 n=1 Tax=Hibiscus sabdariffa TaxID=183260 RepID=A0ABR2NW53_9ROSI